MNLSQNSVLKNVSDYTKNLLYHELISEQCIEERNPSYQDVYDLQLRHAGTCPPQPCALLPNTSRNSVPC